MQPLYPRFFMRKITNNPFNKRHLPIVIQELSAHDIYKLLTRYGVIMPDPIDGYIDRLYTAMSERGTVLLCYKNPET